MLYDKAKIWVEGGRGGDGVVSFRREAHVPRGGPDGGDGGSGGDIVVVCDAQRRDLSSLGRSKHFRAGRGAHGEGSRKHGERGEDRIVVVAPGTVVRGLDGSVVELL
ncbi:MAG: GTPase ObgE, partial [Solirubrobacterales bacterium]|nr:GTPase ObgE [Solirubrobacterales bacterium]